MKARLEETANAASTMESIRLELQVRGRSGKAVLCQEEPQNDIESLF